MSDFTAHDIHLLDQGAVDALRAVDALAADPETARRLTERGEAAYGAELTADLHNTVGGRAMSLAGWAAFATIRLVQAQARHTVDHDAAARMWAEDVDMVWAKVAERDAELEKLRAEREHMELNPTGTAEWLKNRVNELTAELEKVRAQLTDANRALDGYKADEVDLLRMQVYAQKPVIDAALTWAEMCEDGGLAPDDCRKSEDELHDAVESYRLMDMALTSAREEQAEVAS